MNVQDYKTAGYNLSTLIGQSLVDRAEREIHDAYIQPLMGRALTEDEYKAEPYMSAIMALSYLLLQQRSISGTRAGGKVKQTEQSSTPTDVELLLQNARICDMKLQAIADKPYDKVHDICGIYFRSHFFHIN